MSAPGYSEDLVPAQPPNAEVRSKIWTCGIRALGGIFVLIVLGLVSAAVYPPWVHARNSRRKTEAKNELKQLGLYFALYEGKFKSYPSDTRAFEVWLRKEGVDIRKKFACSRCGNGMTFLWDAAPSRLSTPEQDLPIAWHRCPLAETGDDRNVLFFQGRVDVFAIGDATDQAIRNLTDSPAKPK